MAEFDPHPGAATSLQHPQTDSRSRFRDLRVSVAPVRTRFRSWGPCQEPCHGHVVDFRESTNTAEIMSTSSPVSSLTSSSQSLPTLLENPAHALQQFSLSTFRCTVHAPVEAPLQPARPSLTSSLQRPCFCAPFSATINTVNTIDTFFPD
jgi:hypothetical protein